MCRVLYTLKENIKIVYSVDEYLDMAIAAGRAPGTIRLYRTIFTSFARYLSVPVSKIHDHLLPENLMKYAGSLKGYSGNTIRERLAILRAYYNENGVEFTGMKAKVLNAKRHTEPDDKPLELETLQKMMDITDERGRAFISVMVSTGMRAGEAAQLKVNDWDGKDTIIIPGKIAKNGHGGRVYLTDEAQEHLNIWMKNRDAFIWLSAIHSAVFARHDICPVQTGKEDRLFASGYTGLNMMFKRLYQKIDGEKGTYRGKITPHSMRKFFRTHLVKTCDLDIVEHLMRHTGYLSGSYVRITDEDIRKQFHAGEHALYITRIDHRIQGSKLDALKRENAELRETLKTVDEKIDLNNVLRNAKDDPDTLIEYANWLKAKKDKKI